MKTFRKFRQNITEALEAGHDLSVLEFAVMSEDEVDEAEGAPTNNVGGGAVAGAGVGPQGEPGVPVRKKTPLMNGPKVDPRMFANKIFSRVAEKYGLDKIGKTNEDVENTFAGAKVFQVDPETYHNCRLGKNRYHRWSKYVGDSEIGQEIRAFGTSNTTQPIVVMNKNTGEMMYLRNADLHNWKGKK